MHATGTSEVRTCPVIAETPSVDGICGTGDAITGSAQPVSPAGSARPAVARDLDLAELSNGGLSLSSLPAVSGTMQTVVLRKEPVRIGGPSSRRTGTRLLVESVRGDRLAVMDPADHHSPPSGISDGNNKSSGEGGGNPGSKCHNNNRGSDNTPDHRVVRDTDGNLYAVMIRSVVEGRHRFKICGDQPMFPGQRKSRESGYHTYAEAKNWSGPGVRFSMKLRGQGAAAGGAPSTSKYVAEAFGPAFLHWGRGRPRGFLIKDAASEGGECARITVLGEAKAVSVRPGHDVRLMICFATIIDEMVENRLR